MRLRAAAIAAITCISIPAVSSAVDFSVSGFATAAYAESDTDLAEFGNQSNAQGIDAGGSFKYDSVAGVQLTARFNESWSAVVQGVARMEPDEGFRPSVDWAYVSWEPTTKLSLRAGLTRVPTYLFSDTIFLGYANTWVRPPLEVYSQSPVFLLEGLDVVWRQSIGPVNVSLQPFYGNSTLQMYKTSKFDANIPSSGQVEIDLKDWYGAAVTAQYGSFLVRGSWSTKTYETDHPVLLPLMSNLQRLGYGQLATDLSMVGKESPILTFGAQYDNGREFAIAEYAERGSQSISLMDIEGMYLTLGKRFGSFTPYATVAQMHVMSPMTNSVIQVPAAASPTLRAGLTFLNKTVNNIAGTLSDQDSYSVGVRYDVPGFSVMNGGVLKLQYDHVNPKQGGRGFFLSSAEGFSDGVNVFSVSFDMVF